MTLIEKLALNNVITNEEVEEELFNICERVRKYNCNEECPVYKLREHDKVIDGEFICDPDCFRNGHSMRMFIIHTNFIKNK